MGRYRIVLGIFFVFVLLTVYAPSLNAQDNNSILLSVPAISQHLTTADPNGDYGTFDCAAADVAMILQYISKQQNASFISDYATIRQTLRNTPLSQSLQEGIDLHDIVYQTAFFTKNALSSEIIRMNTNSWQLLLRSQLKKSLPVIVYISNWNFLPNHVNKIPAPHAIVIVGLDNQFVYYNDSWDQKTHRMYLSEFENAWSSLPYAFYGIVFRSA